MGISCIISPQKPRSASAVVTTQITQMSLFPLLHFCFSFYVMKIFSNSLSIMWNVKIEFFLSYFFLISVHSMFRVCENFLWRFLSIFFFKSCWGGVRRLWKCSKRETYSRRKKNNWNNFFIDFPFHWTCFQNYFNSREI